MIRVKIKTSEAKALLKRLVQSAPLMVSKALQDIGLSMVSSTQDNFERERSPDGMAWQPLAPSTIVRRKAGRGSKALQDTRRLYQSITYAAGAQSVTIGTNVEYAAFHQFGQGAAPSGYQSQVPARPFLGVGAEDKREIAEILRGVLRKVAGV